MDAVFSKLNLIELNLKKANMRIKTCYTQIFIFEVFQYG